MKKMFENYKAMMQLPVDKDRELQYLERRHHDSEAGEPNARITRSLENGATSSSSRKRYFLNETDSGTRTADTSISEQILTRSGNRSTRTSARIEHNKTSAPVYEEKFSETHGLGPTWDSPLVYPQTGKKRTTVEYSDLYRLDDGEFLNDNIIEFYIR
jgi:Ulp1 family protease